MIDPYKTLGVSPSATEEEIKKAYKTLSKKYHPDANINNPNKDQAEERFKEVQEAYNSIMDMKKRGDSFGYGNAGGSPYGNAGGNPYGGSAGGNSYGDFYEDIFRQFSYGGFANSGSRATGSDPNAQRLNAAANYITNGYYSEALNVLDSIPDHSAMWYYYSALANNGVGNNVTAIEHARMASSLEPNNLQYSQLVRALESGTYRYNNRQSPYGNVYSFGSGSCCNVCGNMCLSCMCLSGMCC